MTLRLLFLFSFLIGGALADPAAKQDKPPVMLLVHGAWGGAWQFARIDPLLRAQGLDVRRATLTGLGERFHLADDELGLETHIEDVVNLIRFEDLQNIILVGHSYGGMVISGVADRMPDRIARLVYLDAFVPNDGDSVATLRTGDADLTKLAQDGFVVPWWVKPDRPYPKDVPHPLKTLTDKISLTNPAAREIPTAYILTVEAGKQADEDDFAPFAARARERGWTVLTLEGDHNPHWRKPSETAALLGTLR